ncbi:peptide ABC transporter substrate-binding protein [Marinomonas sp. CT5]|uniref:ABC transporter substrate-binding protein n=1 Tax=Marinomonas sp. CT5 TaxID=2066133 RepID=UPI001BAFEBF6|nr:ABC transporter substrate-binding protein [Marinomonas sp. CT5]QUX95593.1 peptide ABC transporter substrate-binding protein [Marinomonas sp. CT5]
MCRSFLRNTSSLVFIFLILTFLPAVSAAPLKGSHVKIYVSSLPYLYTSHAVNGSLLRPANNERGWEYYMATSHSQISDTVYEFKLREGVKFQDGTPFNADAVIENMEYFKKKPFLFSKINTVYDHTEKVDDYTVRFYLKEKYGTFLNDVIWIQFYTTKYLEKFGWNGKATCPNLAEAGPYGLGPYMLSEGYIEGDRKTDKAVLTVNPYYYDKDLAKVEKFTIYTKLDPKVALSDVIESEGFLDIMSIAFSDVKLVSSSPYARLVTGPSTDNIAIHINMVNGNEKLKDKNVRLALNRAIDQQQLLSYAFSGYGQIKPTLASPNFPGVKEAVKNLKAYSEIESPKEIRKELKSILGGLKLKVLTQQKFMFLWRSIDRDLRKVGVELDFEIVDETTIFGQVLSTNAGKNTKSWDLIVWGDDDWYFNHPWAAVFVYQPNSVWSTMPADPQMGKYIDDMFKAAANTPQFSDVMTQMINHVYENAYMLVVPAPNKVVAVNKKVSYTPLPMASLPLWEIEVSEDHWSVKQ